MKRIVFGALAASLAVAPAIAAKFTMQLRPSAEQTARMDGGIGAVDAHGSNSSVRLIQAEGELKKRGVLQVIVMNHGEKSFNFGPENVTAKLADGTPVAIVTYDQLLREEKKRQTWAAVAAGLAAAGNSMSAANSGHYSGTATYSGSTYGSFGSTPYRSNTVGTATVTGYNAGQAQVAQSLANQQNQANFARMSEQNASKMQALKVNMRTTTVDPHQMFGGSVTFELPKSARKQKAEIPLTFVVLIEGQVHSFDAILNPR